VPPHEPVREPTDSTLIRRFLDAGDEFAFRALHERHTPHLRMLLARLLGSQRDELDDIVQDAWLAGCRGLGTFNGTAQFSTWLTTIGIRAAWARLNAGRNGDGYASVSADSPEPDELAAPPLPATTTTIDLERALDRLNAHQRAVVVLHDVEGYTHAEIAEQLGLTPANSKVTLFRARGALRRMLDDGEPR
jgi:RNA polymerase sigma-70 factor (ECF subfamily)